MPGPKVAIYQPVDETGESYSRRLRVCTSENSRYQTK